MALLCFASSAGLTRGACDVGLLLEPAQTTFSLSGTASVAAFQNLPLKPKQEDGKVGMQGVMPWTSSRVDCPSSNGELKPFVEGGLLGGGKLDMYPEEFALVVGPSLAELTFRSVEFELSVEGLEETGSVWNGNFSLGIASGIVDYEVSEGLGVEPGNASLAGKSASAQLDGRIELDNGEIVLMLEDAKFSFDISLETGLEALPTVDATLILEGAVAARGLLGCGYCGVNGRCVDLPEGLGCQCACGWSGEGCNTADGFCERFGSVSSAEVVVDNVQPLGNLSTGLDLENECADFFSKRQCFDKRSSYNPNTQVCECERDWEGKTCEMCTDNSACDNFLRVSKSTCRYDLLYDSHTALKLYECDLEGTDYEAFVGKQLSVKCHTTAPSNTVESTSDDNSVEDGKSILQNIIGKSPYCEVGFDFLKADPVECKAWGCDFALGSALVECKTMQCECLNDCPESLKSIINNLGEVSFSCSAETDSCSMDLTKSLGVEVTTGCRVRECYDPNSDIFVFAKNTEEKWTINMDILIISIPVTIVTTALLLLGVPTFFLSRHINRGPRDIGTASRRVGSTHAIAKLSFEDVTCSVPVFGASETTPIIGGGSSESDEEQPKSEAPMSNIRSVGLHPELREMAEEGKHQKSILRGVTGSFKRGQVVGIMGPSGSGKSTFLSIISNIEVEDSGQKVVHGKITIDGREPGPWMKKLTAFVPQEDKLLPTLTVRESMMYSALLRLPGISMQSSHVRTANVLRELALESVADSLVGGVPRLRGISGGERRRVTIGMELITDPSLVVLDEPLSGLDSFTALKLMHTLKGISSAGRLVILSVHQPTPKMLNLLDQVLLLAKGFQVYLGTPQGAPQYFADRGFPCPKDAHIAEYMLEAVSGNSTLISLLNSVHEHSSQGRNKGLNNHHASLSADLADSEELFVKSNFITSMEVLTWRGFVDIVRNPSMLLSQTLMALMIGLGCGVVFFDAKLDLKGAQNRLGAIFFLLAFMAFSSLTTIDLLHSERGIVLREVQGGYYSPFHYVATKILLDAVLLRMIPAALLSIPLYFMLGMQPLAVNFVIYILTVCTFNLLIGALSMAVTIISPTSGTASLAINTVLLISLLFMGHLVHLPDIPKIVRWLHYCSPFSYAFYCLAVNEMAGLKMSFEVTGYASVDGVSGKVFLSVFGLEPGHLKENLSALNLFYLVSLLLVFAAMCATRNDSRQKMLLRSARKKLLNRPEKVELTKRN